MMISNNHVCPYRRVFLVALFMATMIASSPVVDAFRAPENPTPPNFKFPPTLTTSKTKNNKPTTTTTSSSSPTPTTTTPSSPGVVGGGADVDGVNVHTLSQVGTAVAERRDATFYAKSRKRWGIDHAENGEYWFDSRIHTFGNIGFWGGFHAALAPISTKLIDMIAYDGEDVRSKVANELSANLSKNSRKAGAKVLDMCCGVGISTRALREAFPDAEKVVGLDTSKEMISMANFLTTHLGFFKPIITFFQNGLFRARRGCHGRTTFQIKNAESTDFDDQSFDLVTVMYAFHEAPKAGRERILREAYRVLQPGGTLAVVDIDTSYTPSDTMLAGEPYVIEYQKNIHRQLKTMKGFSNMKYETIVPEHVGMWILKRSPL
eukprot:CAMPEP_0113446016 /NCGR_PEP_ID=MMETSP0014_2-20120614/3485_1 /TAXON_ID=2857 /ORGANISM="Nitzschia sp." /LENGTH=376 /DNA_ID=CAMNT_0000337087 /DNA_START=1551 /DNA_END=2681 /DNA_ORIENTATION=- /assembly_acc=CAM_ASM_000159